jgi:hypothetical protein
MTTYRLLVESWGREHLAFCRELPGFQMSAPSVGSLEDQAPAGIARHLDWLGANGWQPARSGPVQATIVERVRKDQRGVLPSFSADLSPLTPTCRR